MRPVYDFICTIGELIDKLIVELLKAERANHAILDERAKEHPDVEKIAHLEWMTRSCSEQRVRLRGEINKRIGEAIERGHMGYAPEVRDFEPGKER
jgi:hypothetical protein